MTDTVMPTYGRLDVTFKQGQGAWLIDAKGERYLDALSGIAVVNLGHCHPKITEAICDQAKTLIHTSNVYHIEMQQKLADKLTALSGMDQVFFCNSGAEANEAAIKLARKYGHQKGIDKPVIIVMDGSFHGRTMATLSATGNARIQAGFEPLVPGFVRVPYDDIDALRMAISHWPEAVAIMLEPVQGEGGIKIPDAEYLHEVRQLCTQRKLLMILDEVQSGIGRTGKWFAFQHHENVLPDVMTLAKALGNGVPVGACLAAGPALGVLEAGNHGSTFGGNPLAARVALTVLETIESEHLIDNVNILAPRMLADFKAKIGKLSGVKSIRQKGFMIGIELNQPCGALVKAALAEHLLINVTADKVIRLLPPMIISAEQADLIVDKVSALVSAFLAENAVESVA
ncbi:MAG: aspartate aminotransferase family protein [Methylophaga sp.]|nr:aspartate aminotransferase family protein [Methylophaga sp.]